MPPTSRRLLVAGDSFPLATRGGCHQGRTNRDVEERPKGKRLKARDTDEEWMKADNKRPAVEHALGPAVPSNTAGLRHSAEEARRRTKDRRRAEDDKAHTNKERYTGRDWTEENRANESRESLKSSHV